MEPVDYGLALVFLIAGVVLGWWANKTYASHGDVKTGKQRLSGYRKTRQHNSLVTAILVLAVGFVVFGLLRLHP